jgi:hypothetical protein
MSHLNRVVLARLPRFALPDNLSHPKTKRSRAPVHTASRYFPKSRDCIPDRFR